MFMQTTMTGTAMLVENTDTCVAFVNSYKYRLFAFCDGRYDRGYNGARIMGLGIRKGTWNVFHNCMATRYDSFPPGPSVYALHAIDDARGAA